MLTQKATMLRVTLYFLDEYVNMIHAEKEFELAYLSHCIAGDAVHLILSYVIVSRSFHGERGTTHNQPRIESSFSSGLKYWDFVTDVVNPHLIVVGEIAM